MEKEIPYFKFSPAKYLSGTISHQDYELQGFFMNVVCLYWQRNCDVTLTWLKQRLSKGQPLLQQLIETGICKHNNDTDKFTINFLDGQHCEFFDLLERRSSAGKKGGQASVKQRLTKRQAKSPQDKIREDKNYSALDLFSDAFKKNTVWLEMICMKFSLPLISDAILFLDKFTLHLKTSQLKKSDEKDFASHFVNWMAKQKSNNVQTADKIDYGYGA